MASRALLADIDPGWLADGDTLLDAELAARARDSALGRRMLAAWLADGPAAALFAPDPGRQPDLVRMRWPRQRLDALLRDIGVLAHAPAIRAETGREPVRRLKAALGNSYLLALDRTVWDGHVERARQAALASALAHALAAATTADGPQPLHALFDAQGRAELVAWARRRDPALADWCQLLHPPGPAPVAWLPEKPVLRIYTHHDTRAA
ncbi:hypothetical protein [Luteimonas sp. MC1825]|uniref:hypothetical protein n=1 Tax=Luteimonas sp. MC1825 TaxID=2761107 RepID=UPI0016188664|nr:hypothetical protein [Luteimonas sp. MC1825]MBB6600460.1 hypothetical protein [Luteimonas sp. MC1825]QOC88125.1 hypothetical protein IDM46_13090 [Luteimonas sp. MC1825]